MTSRISIARGIFKATSVCLMRSTSEGTISGWAFIAPPCNSIVEVERASSDLVASAADDALTTGPSSVDGRQDFAMCRVKTPLIAAFEGSMGGDKHAIFEDADLVGEYVNIE